MSFSLICPCGARIELEDAFAGQEIACPECQQPLKAPAGAAQGQPVRTSAFALASLILAVIGAFTIVGTIVAVILGIVAIITIRRQRERLAGLGFAVSGIIIGAVCTPLTLYAITMPEPFAVAGWLRERNMAGLVDTTGPMEVIDKGWAITRPTEQWGVSPTGQIGDEIAELFLKKSAPDVLLVQVKHNAYLDVRKENIPNKQSLVDYLSQYLSEYKESDLDVFNADANAQGNGFLRITHGEEKRPRRLTSLPPGCDEGHEVQMEVLAAGQKWTMIVRIYSQTEKQGRNRFYVLCAYTPRRAFTLNHADFEKTMDSFRLVK